MIARHYRSSSVRGALAQAREELGPRALVLASRLVPAAGWRGWLGARDVEVSAVAPSRVSENRRDESTRDDSDAAPAAPATPRRPHANGLVARLMATGIDVDLAEATVEALPASARRDPSQGQLRTALATCLVPLAGADTAGHVQVLVGPPGVGKTTTIAKLAAQARTRGGQRYRIIAADGYRVGAVEQLRLYAEIIGVPCVVTRTPQELTAAIHASRLPVLVDTPGLSPANEEAAAFFEALAGVSDVTTHLVVPAATTGRDLDRLWTRFEPVGPSRIVISKIDEAETPMPLVKRLRERELRISLLGVGQQVPEDLAAATPDTLAACLLGQPPRTESE